MTKLSPAAVLPLPDGRLRAMTADDWLVEIALSRDHDVVRWTFYPEDIDEQEARMRCKRAVERSAAGMAYRWVVEEPDGRAVGICGIAVRPGVVELFYALLPEGRGSGRATRTVDVLASMVEEGGATPVLVVEVGNERSEAVAARAGFRAVSERHEPDGVTVRVWERHERH